MSRLGALGFAFACLLVGLSQGAEVLSPEEEAELREKGARPVLEATPAALVGTVEQGGTATLAISIRNAGGQVLRWSVSFAPAWAKAVPEGGELAHGGRAEVLLAVDASALQPGSTRGDVVVSAPGADGSPAKVSVTVQVRPRAAEGARAPHLQAAPPAGAKSFKVSVGAGAFGCPEIVRRDSPYYSGGEGATPGIFGVGFQIGSYEMIVVGPTGENVGWYEQYGPTEWFEWKMSQEGPILLFRKYWGKPLGWRFFAQLGHTEYWLDIRTEVGGDFVKTAYTSYGIGVRRAFSHGYVEFSADALNGGGDEAIEPHVSFTGVWRFPEDAGRFGAMVGLTF